ncbi:hypothetical protein [Amycolatopsis benzoatilytica]|uniref:hypothetical protein n=1 Tax=Amycolatopsis benzoatilytica TaxID=346045 RepID=UPI0003A21273|nr:hypothetical protein [Amycolatopsis benzoatilytica]
MTYPQNPQGQQPPSGQFPGQPYPGSQPTPAQPYPGAQPQPYAQPVPGQPYGVYPGGPGVLSQKPSGGTAITAGVLAIIGGIWAIISVIISISALSALHVGFHGIMWSLYLGIGVYAINIGLLIYGGIGLFLHQPAGRICTIIGCGLTIAFGILSAVTSGIAVSSALRHTSGVLGMGIGFALVALIPPIATLILAIVKPTADWVSFRPNAAGPQAGAYPPAQGW